MSAPQVQPIQVPPIQIPTAAEVASSPHSQAPAVPLAGNALGDWGDADPSWSHNQVPAVPMAAIRIPTDEELRYSRRRQTPAPPSAAACAPGGSCGCTGRDLSWPVAANSMSQPTAACAPGHDSSKA